jgi:hypothetical protein
MLQKSKITVAQFFANPNWKAVLFLTGLLIAALAGGAPNDHTGG